MTTTVASSTPVASTPAVGAPHGTSGAVRIVGATPVHSLVAHPRGVLSAAHAPKPACEGRGPTADDDEAVWIELESTLRAREAAKALHPSRLVPRLQLTG